MLRWLPSIAVLMLCPEAGAQQVYSTGFPGGELPPEMGGFATPGFGVGVGGGVCALSKEQGVANGTASARLCWWVDGDFTATVTADRSAADAGSSGLIVWYPGQLYVNIFFSTDTGAIGANIFQSSAGSRSIASAGASADFRIARTGEEIAVEFDTGSGWTPLHSNTSPNLLGAVAVGLFYTEDRGNQAPARFAFDDFSVEAGVFTECYADCDCNHELNIFDFLCFQDAFVNAEPYADCDGSTAFDIFDFLCFQDAFVGGCP